MILSDPYATCDDACRAPEPRPSRLSRIVDGVRLMAWLLRAVWRGRA